MKQFFSIIIVFFISVNTFGHYNLLDEWKNRCSHQPDPRKKTTDYLYNWQNSNMDKYDVTFYWLDLNVSSASINVSGNTSIYAKVKTSILDTFAFELIPEMTIDSFVFNGQRYNSYVRDGDNVLYRVDSVSQGELITAKVFYHGAPPTGGFFAGVTHDHNGYYNKDVTWTLSEPFMAKDWFPVKQDLEDKADSAWIFLTCPDDEMAGSNGLLTAVVDLGNGKKRYEWKEHHKIDYYLISFSVADYRDYSIYAHPDSLNGDSVLIQNFIYDDDNCYYTNKAVIDKTADILELYSNLYITYPFADEKYGHCLTELGGGMEHQTMTTIGGFSFHLVAHELGHMWFGDNVTCATWQDIWINEGFATYSDYLANEKLQGWNAAQNFIKSAQNKAMSIPGGTIYIPESLIKPGNEWRIFDGRLSYNKGAAIIHELRHEIQSDSLFFQCMSLFQTRFTDSVATGDDFKNVVEDVTGKDWDWYFNEWYYGEGYPIYDFVWFYDETNKEFHLDAVQSTSASTGFFKQLFDVKLTFEDGSDTLIRFQQTYQRVLHVFPTDKRVTGVAIDPYNWTMEKTSSLVSGIKEQEANPAYFIMGPNPADNWVNLYFKNSNLKTVMVSDLAGRMVFHSQTAKKKLKISLTNLPKGIYMVDVYEGRNHFVKKLVK